MTIHDATNRSKNRDARIANSEVSIIRELIEWTNVKINRRRTRRLC